MYAKLFLFGVETILMDGVKRARRSSRSAGNKKTLNTSHAQKCYVLCIIIFILHCTNRRDKMINGNESRGMDRNAWSIVSEKCKTK